jgi:hypothetical protein
VRKITDEDIKRYKPMVESFLRKSVIKNWNEASTSKSKDEVSLGNSGMTMADFRQYLNTEVFVALTKYNPNFRTPEGKSVQESTFIFRHLSFRIGQCLKRLTKKRQGYGYWTLPVEKVLGESKEDQQW